MDGGKLNVPAAGAVVAVIFEMVEESTKESGVEVLQLMSVGALRRCCWA